MITVTTTYREDMRGDKKAEKTQYRFLGILFYTYYLNIVTGSKKEGFTIFSLKNIEKETAIN